MQELYSNWSSFKLISVTFTLIYFKTSLDTMPVRTVPCATIYALFKCINLKFIEIY